MRIEQIQRHLHRIEHKSVLIGDFEHVKVNARIFMSRKTDVTNLARFSSSHKSGVGSIGIIMPWRAFFLGISGRWIRSEQSAPKLLCYLFNLEVAAFFV